MTTHATLRSRRTKAKTVYHVREPSAGESPTSLIIKIQGYIFVAYRDTMVLRLPHAATSLGAAPPESAPRTKLTTHAVTELISFATQCEVLCPATQRNSGIDSPPRGKPVSALTSQRSSRR